MGVVFDKLGFMRKLEGDGDFTRPQAEKLTEAFYDAVVESVATKQDVGDVRSELKEVRSDLKQDIAALRSDMGLLRNEIKTEIAQLKVWAAGVGVVIISVLSALKFFS